MNKGQVIAEAAVRFERILPAPAQKVWRFLTEPSLLAGWYGEGMIEPREGGKVTLMSGHIKGVVTGWRPHNFLAHSWNVFQPDEAISIWPVSYLEFALAADGGDTSLILTHRPILKAMQNQTLMGWHTFLDLLAEGLDGKSVGPRGVHMQKNAALYGVDLNNLKR